MSNYKMMSMKSIAKQLNDRTFTDYFFRLSLYARTRYEWENLPNGIDEKWIENYLFYEGKCLFFKDENLGLMVAKCNYNGPLNNYDEPINLFPFGTNYRGKIHTNGVDCVLIRNNDDMLPTRYTIDLYALKLANIDRCIDVNVNAQKTPVLVRISDKDKLSLKTAYSQVTGNEPVIYVDKLMSTDVFGVFKTDAPIVFDKLQIQKKQVWNEVMTYLGINNANMDKRERLVDDEVQANNEQVEISAQIGLKSRELACKQINEMFGTNISVKLRDLKYEELEELEGGVNDDE